MSDVFTLKTPLKEDELERLSIGNRVLITGIIYTARDAAHKRLIACIDQNEQLPFDIKNQIIYYVGPAPARPGMPIGSCGPTTSSRMDIYTPKLLAKGLKATIGKGNRSPAVIEAMKKYKAVYFVAIGGAGALLAKSVLKSEVIAFEDLGTEAVFRLEVERFPVIVANDIYGNDLFTRNIEEYRRD